MKPTVYVETTVISYLTARLSRDIIIVAHQQITQQWWEHVRPCVQCVVSPFVIQEARRGDPEFAQKRLNSISEFPILALNQEIKELAEKYATAIQIPDSAQIDAFHLAFSVWYKLDYLLTWNCKHLASGRVRKILETLNKQLKLVTPVICTPEELMEV